MTSLEGKTAVVTGSTSGIGLGIAISFAQSGARLMLNGLASGADIEKAQKNVRDAGAAQVAFSDANMMKPDAIRSMIAEAEKKLGPIDILVNNAGIQFVAPIDEFPEDKWDAVISINLSAAFHSIKACIPGMKKRNAGRIINIASAHALVASPYKAAYVAAKHAIAGLTKVVALEIAEHKITCNAICPGYVWTPLVEKQIPEQMAAHQLSREDVINKVLLDRQPSKRFVTVEEMGALATFLSGDGAASINGAILPVDGGWNAQ